MRARIKRTANIMQVPSEFAKLEKITQGGEFVYKVKFRIDPVKAVRAKAFKVRISAAEQPEVKKTFRTFTNFNAELITKRLLARPAALKDIARQRDSARFFTYLSDITKRIPNSRTIHLSKGVFTAPQIATKVRRIRPALASDLTDRNLRLPVLDQNLNRNIDSDRTVSTRLIRSSATRLLFGCKCDPASFVGARTNVIRSAVRASAGTVSKKTPSNQSRLAPGRLLVGSLLNNRRYSNQAQVNSSRFLNTIVREESSWIEIEEELRIPIGDLDEDEFYYIFELVDMRNIRVQTITRAVPHSKNVSQLQIPTKAPTVSAVPIGKLGKTVLNIKQNDLNATSVNIYRRDVKKAVPNIDAQYDLVGSLDIEQGYGFRKIEDVYASTNPIIYRVVPVNSNGILGAEFDSVVVQQQRGNLASRTNFFRRTYYVSVTHEILDSSIVISVSDVPSGPIAVSLQRKDKTINQRTFTSIGDITLVDEDSNAPIVFEDSSVKEDRIYEYRVILLFIDGASEIAANNLIIEFCPIANNILSLEVTEPEVEESGDDVDVIFNITKNVIQGDADLVKTFLGEQGFTSEYQDQLLANRNLLQDLFAVRITRTNLGTGELEDFGIIDSADFSDKKFGRVKGVKPLQGGFGYNYNITAHARETDTLFETLSRTITPRTNVSYSFAPAKWKHPLALLRGNLSSQSSRLRNHSKSTFTFGRVVDTQNVVVSLADIIPSLTEGKISQFGESNIFIQWKVQGNVNKIDHFIVILDVLGIRTVVGKSHNITNSNYFQFVDELTNQECGELTYYIVPVMFDYSRGPELKTNSVVI